MKLLLFVMAGLMGLMATAKFSMNDAQTIDATLPNTDTPSELTGSWVNGYTSLTQVVDAYNGRNLGTTWASGKLFKFSADGTGCEAYFLFKSQYATSATKVMGSVRFDPGSSNSRGSFTFLALKGHYKGWGSANVDRDATAEELAKNLTRKYYYRMDGEWLRIQPGAEPNDYSSSFRKSQ